jgi:hypothetical protein
MTASGGCDSYSNRALTLAHNGKMPDLVEEEERFTVRLWK